MAIVANEYTRWQGKTGSPQDVGYLLVWAENTGQRQIDRVEIDNGCNRPEVHPPHVCNSGVWVHVVDDDGTTVLFSEHIAPGALYTNTQMAGVRWNRSTQNKVSQWFVSVATESTGA